MTTTHTVLPEFVIRPAVNRWVSSLNSTLLLNWSATGLYYVVDRILYLLPWNSVLVMPDLTHIVHVLDTDHTSRRSKDYQFGAHLPHKQDGKPCKQRSRSIRLLYRLSGSFYTLAELGSYAAQALFGEFSERDHGPDSSYIRRIRVAGSTELINEIARRHCTALE